MVYCYTSYACNCPVYRNFHFQIVQYLLLTAPTCFCSIFIHKVHTECLSLEILRSKFKRGLCQHQRCLDAAHYAVFNMCYSFSTDLNLYLIIDTAILTLYIIISTNIYISRTYIWLLAIYIVYVYEVCGSLKMVILGGWSSNHPSLVTFYWGISKRVSVSKPGTIEELK
jgi:hypothetical protein